MPTPALTALSGLAAAAADPADRAPANLLEVVLPLTVLVLVGLAIPAFMLVANHVLSRWAHGRGAGATSPGKREPYEGGLTATVGTADERFSVKFYLIAMLFLAFDLEVAFLYPWAVQFNKGGWEMLWMLLPFLLMLEVAYLYLFKKGALDWDR